METRAEQDRPWKTAGAQPALLPVAGLLLLAATGCGMRFLRLLDPLAEPPPDEITVVNTFGQLTTLGADRVPAHYLTIDFDPDGLPIPAPASGTISYVAELNGLTSCLRLQPRVSSNLDDELAAELKLLDPELPAPGRLYLALCNLENGAGELRGAVGTLFQDAFTRAGKEDDPLAAADQFLAADPARPYQFVDVWQGDENHADSTLGVAAGGVLQVAAYTAGGILDRTEEPYERTFFNPAPFLAPYLRDTAIGAAFDAQRPAIAAVAIDDGSGGVELASAAGSPPTAPSTAVGFRFLLEPGQVPPAATGPIVPYEVRYELNLVTRNGSDVTGSTLKSHGIGRLNELQTHVGPAPDDYVAPAVADRLYAADGEHPETYWMYLALDPSSPAPAEPSSQNLTLSTFQREIDLGAEDGGRVFPAGEYELVLTIQEPFAATADEFRGYFHLGEATLVANVTGETSRYLDHDDVTPATEWAIGYEISGTGSFDRVHWTVRRKSDGTPIESATVMSGARSGTVVWLPAEDGSPPPPDRYEIELEVLDGADSKGTSAPFGLTLYRMSITPASGAVARGAPGLHVPVNGDDDDADGTADSDPGAGFDGDDDLVEVTVGLEPAIAGAFEISSVGAPASIKAWTSRDKAQAWPLPRTIDPSAEAPPYTIFLEGATSGALELLLRHETADGTVLASAPYAVTVFSVEALEDSDGDRRITAADDAVDHVRIGLWDHAFEPVADPFTPPALLNGQSEDENFVGSDSRRFYFRVRDVSATPGAIAVGNFEWFTIKANGDHDDYPPTHRTLTLTESGAGTEEYASVAVMLVPDAVDRNQPTHPGLPAGTPAAYDRHDHRTREASEVDDLVVARYRPAGAAGPAFDFRWPVFDRDPDDRRNLVIEVFNFSGGSTGVEAIPETTIAAAIESIEDRFLVAGLRANVTHDAATHLIDLGASPVNLNSVADAPTANVPFGSLEPSGDELVLIDAVRRVSPAVPENANTIYLLFIGRFADTGLNGEAFADGVTQAGSPGRNFAFVAGRESNFDLVPAHEIGHFLTNGTMTEDEATGQVPGWAAGSHYGGDQEGQNLMFQSLLLNPHEVYGPRRLWDDVDQHVVQQITRARSTRFAQP